MAQSNPNKVNQFTMPDPRQELFFQYFLDRESDTFSNVTRSAMKAGFEESYAKVLTDKMPKWLSERVRDEELIQMAENNVKEFLSPSEEDKKVKADITKFVLKGLRKEKYSERMEHTGANGKAIEFKEIKQASDEDLYKVLNENNTSGS